MPSFQERKKTDITVVKGGRNPTGASAQHTWSVSRKIIFSSESTEREEVGDRERGLFVWFVLVLENDFRAVSSVFYNWALLINP